MNLRPNLHCMAIAAALAAVNLEAAPIDFTTGIATGVVNDKLFGASLRDGLEITLPVQDYVLNKTYTAQLVPTGSDEKKEAYAQVGANKDFGFGSAVSDGKGALEVGVFNTIRDISVWAAVSRYYTTIKNNTDDDLEFDFFYVIDPGELAVHGIRADFTAHARVEATIDYVLLTPNGGTYDETEGQLFSYFADIGFDSQMTASPNADVILYAKNDFNLGYATSALKGSVALPTIPGRGELTFYYDMFALFASARAEVGGLARLGDPTLLDGGGGAGLVRRTSDISEVPEPSTMLLLGAGLLAVMIVRRKSA